MIQAAVGIFLIDLSFPSHQSRGRLREAREQGWSGGVVAIETTLAAARQKLQAMRDTAEHGSAVSLGMPAVRQPTGRREVPAAIGSGQDCWHAW